MVIPVKILLRIIWTVKNWPWAFAVYVGFLRKCTAVFRNDYRFALDRATWPRFMTFVNLFRDIPGVIVINDHRIQVSYRGKDLIFDVGKWGIHGPVENFKNEPYKKFLNETDLKDKVVVDIGANIGDTAIYFALWGAQKVYSYEPFPGWFNQAQKNIQLNHLESVCEVMNAAVGGSSGYFLDDSTYKDLFSKDSTAPLLFEGEKDRQKIPVVTLADIVQKFSIRNAFLKVDCEGYEYDIILSSSREVLNSFDYIVIEYHYGYERLKEKLEEMGFSVSYTQPMHSPSFNRPGWPEGQVGYITARRTAVHDGGSEVIKSATYEAR